MNDFCLTLDDFLDPSLIDEGYRSIIKEDFDSFFVKKDDLTPERFKYDNWLLDIITQTWEKLPFLNSEIAGFEIWTNSMDYENILSLHCDVDEVRMDTKQECVHPLYTSVLYLGPQNKLEGGNLRLNLKDTFKDLLSNPEKIEEEGLQENLNENWIEIPYRYNRLVVFDPKRPHLITKIEKGDFETSPRVGLTMAAWNYEIEIAERYIY